MKLVIVESPAKAKTIEKYLGSDFTVDASKGHVRDLPVKSMGVDIKNNFKPEYLVRTADQKATIQKLKTKLKKCDEVFLATDPDREGEAISWHLAEVLGLSFNDKNRIVFNEISKSAVQKAISEPRKIDLNLVDAQQARRVLDRLVGYTLSPVLCKKVQNKLSAGRVQSAALKIIVDREREIDAFNPEEYWTLTGIFSKHNQATTFKATLVEKDSKKLKIKDAQQAQKALDVLQNSKFVVSDVKKTQSVSKNPAPFTTSTMQQEAINKLKMSASSVRSLSQQLYEGLDIPTLGHVALITYIRTDSVRVSQDAQIMAKNFLQKRYGENYVPEKFNFYASSKSSQDAHEAIRPINLEITPESIKDKVQKGHYSLYKLIYERFLASQSTNAKYENLTVKISADENYCLEAKGKTVVFDGYTKIYNDSKKDEDSNTKMPSLSAGDVLDSHKLEKEQKFTKGPPRYTEATLIKALEEQGIGRPSTFDSIVTTLFKRDYMQKSEKVLVATSLGKTVTEYLETHFPNIVDLTFTAQMESNLDNVEQGESWQSVVAKYFNPLQKEIDKALVQDKMKVQDESTDEICPVCQSPVVIKHGRFGKYFACSNYPTNCNYHYSSKGKSAPKATEQVCELCGAQMLEREGRFGKYIACSNYPKCKNTKSISEAVAKCPECGADVVKRISKKGKVFYICSNNTQSQTKCDFISWDIPTEHKCPKCNSFLLKKEFKAKTVLKCSNTNCDYTTNEKD